MPVLASAFALMEAEPTPVRTEVSKSRFELFSACRDRAGAFVVMARLPSNFHLLRQMKVTKAKALNTYLCRASAQRS